MAEIVGVLYGGPSIEREVSIHSAQAVQGALEATGMTVCGIDVDPGNIAEQLHDAKITYAFNVCHGQFGEDGHLQAVLDNLGIPYSGSGLLASALAMDKWRCKRIWQRAGLPTTQGMLLRSGQSTASLPDMGWPRFVKPNHGGSSLGVGRVGNEQELQEAIARAFALDAEVLVEAAVAGRELTVAIVANEALPAIIIEPQGDFYDYHAKYLAQDTRYLLPSGLPRERERMLQDLALQAFLEIGGEGWGRVDFLLDAEEQPFLLEVNSVPGMTSHSLVPMAAKARGWNFGELCLRIMAAKGEQKHG